eukprot:5740949-Lingulodinium_polyedra.AAC.1
MGSLARETYCAPVTAYRRNGATAACCVNPNSHLLITSNHFTQIISKRCARHARLFMFAPNN